jgi:flagellar hook-associated protein 1
MSLCIALQNAVSGLHLNQRALDVTAQNVANVNTEGCSRKTISRQAAIIAGQGAGVEIADISRTVDEFMLKDLRVQISAMADFDERNEFCGRMQDLFGSPGSDSSIGVSIADLASRMQALSASPENNSLMTEITSRAELISLQFNQIVEEIESLRLEADTNIGTAVTTVNTRWTESRNSTSTLPKTTAPSVKSCKRECAACSPSIHVSRKPPAQSGLVGSSPHEFRPSLSVKSFGAGIR